MDEQNKKKWFVTVGVPGGEYAVRSPNILQVEELVVFGAWGLMHPGQTIPDDKYFYIDAILEFCDHCGIQRPKVDYKAAIDRRDEMANAGIKTEIDPRMDPVVLCGKRPAPFDLVEWLQATMGKELFGRRKVPGGWLFTDKVNSTFGREDIRTTFITTTFIPVRSAAGLTVID